MEDGVQLAEIERLKARFLELAEKELLAAAETIAACEGQNLFGPTEFALRDIFNRLAAKTLEVGLAERKKRRTQAPNVVVRTARALPVSKAIAAKRS